MVPIQKKELSLGYLKEMNRRYYKIKYKCTYSRYNLPEFIDGRKVKHYMQVYSADDAEGDEFIPIYNKRYKRKISLLKKFIKYLKRMGKWWRFE